MGPAEQRVAPAERRAAPAEQRAAPAELPAAPAEQRVAPAEQRAAPAEQRVAPAEQEALELAAQAASSMRARRRTAAVPAAARATLRAFVSVSSLTSQAAMIALSGNQKGFGGDLRFGEADGLTGADKILARRRRSAEWPAMARLGAHSSASPKDRAAHRSTPSIASAMDLWYDRQARLIAMSKADLLQARPKGADPAIINDLPNETGVPNQFPGGTTMAHDNHATLTGSGPQGTLWSTGLAGICQDWTSSVATGGKPHVGYTFPRGTTNNWISIMDEPPCLAGGTIDPTGGDADPDQSFRRLERWLRRHLLLRADPVTGGAERRPMCREAGAGVGK